MKSAAGIFLERRAIQAWHDKVEARVSIALLLLVFLAIPTFLLLIQNSIFILYYLVYPPLCAAGIYLMSRGKAYLGSIVVVFSVYLVVAFMSWLIGFGQVHQLKWWIIALLPWVMFSESRRLTIIVMTLIPVFFSLVLRYLPNWESPLLPAERVFIRHILSMSVALGGFSALYFMRRQYFATERLRRLENEFYSNTLDSIPLPIIIKDGITLEYVFFNSAAQLTYDLRPDVRNSNVTTFSETSATAVSRLDQEVLRSVTYHIEPDENLVHTTGIHWHFRTYRIPLELESSGRRLLITISEDLRALNLAIRRAEETRELTARVFNALSPLVARYDIKARRVTVLNPPEWLHAWTQLESDMKAYLEFNLAAKNFTEPGFRRSEQFVLAGRNFELYLLVAAPATDVTCIVFEARRGA
jgi:PAS domain-containing protein